jgi:hypothetical protein
MKPLGMGPDGLQLVLGFNTSAGEQVANGAGGAFVFKTLNTTGPSDGRAQIVGDPAELWRCTHRFRSGSRRRRRVARARVRPIPPRRAKPLGCLFFEADEDIDR